MSKFSDDELFTPRPTPRPQSGPRRAAPTRPSNLSDDELFTIRPVLRDTRALPRREDTPTFGPPTFVAPTRIPFVGAEAEAAPSVPKSKLLLFLAPIGADIGQVLAEAGRFLKPVDWLIAAWLPATLIFVWLCSDVPGTAPGVKISGQDVGGLSLGELQRAVSQRAQKLADTPVSLVFGGATNAEQSLSVKPKDLAVWEKAPLPAAPFTNVSTVVARAYLAGRELNLGDRFNSRYRLRFERGAEFPLRATLDEDRLKRRLHALKKRPVDARLIWTGAGTRIQKEVPGLEVDPHAALQQIETALSSGQTTIQVPARAVAPRVMAADLAGLTSQVVASVPITSKNPNAKLNAEISARALQSVTIAPGETISLNQIIGERTVEEGYKSAAAFSNGKVVSEIGAGICYTATCAFQVAKKSSCLSVMERYGHSKKVLYAVRGTDATLAWGFKDLKLRNTSKKPVVLMVWVKGKRVFARVLSAPAG